MLQKFIPALFIIFIVSSVALAQEENLTPYEIALQRIEEARVSGAAELDLRNLGLEELPPEIGDLENLRILKLGFNQFHSFPFEVTSLSNLRWLDIDLNFISSLPTEFGNLSNLEWLNLGRNRLYDLPLEFGNLTRLRMLGISDNMFQEFPLILTTLVTLESLSIGDNPISILPPEIGNLRNLHNFSLGNMNLSYLPSEIGQLTSLKVLFLANNQLVNLPNEFQNLRQLCNLTLSGNQLQYLPTFIGEFQHLDDEYCIEHLLGANIHVDDNPLISPPPEVIAQGTPAILEYLRNEAWWHFQRLLVGGVSFVGILAAAILGLRWKNRRGKSKRKNEG